MPNPEWSDIIGGALDKAAARPRPPSKAQVEAERQRCAADVVYFVTTYCRIYDNDTKSWIPFSLWPFQVEALREASAVLADGLTPVYPRFIILKARQEGFTWLLGIAQKLWKMLFHPITEVLVFSQSDEDAMAVLAEERLKGMYKLLPDWLKEAIKKDNDHEVRFDNGSGIRALPESRGGDSRTVTDVVIDEADLITDLDDLLARCTPTLGEKGQLIIIGRAVKKKPNSAFKRRYKAAKAAMLSGERADWNKVMFAPWYYRTAGRTKFIATVREVSTSSLQLNAPTLGAFDFLTPDGLYPHRLLNTRTGSIRTIMAADGVSVDTAPALDDWRAGDTLISMVWKDGQDREALATAYSLDSVHEQYPATDDEALSAAALDKRYAPEVVALFTRALAVLLMPTAVPGLRVFIEPQAGHHYGIGADPAGGMSDSDDSYASVLDADTLEQVAVYQNKTEPTQFANVVADISTYYSGAPVLFELNNHGIAFLAQAKQRGINLRMGMNRRGDTERLAGWLTSERSKNTLYDTGAKVFDEALAQTRDDDGTIHPEFISPIIHDAVTASQLSAIDKNTLKAPPGDHDDAAVAWVLSIMCVYRGSSSMTQVKHTLWASQTLSAPVARPQIAAPRIEIERTPESWEETAMRWRMGRDRQE